MSEGLRGQVVKLDRSYPLIKLESGELIRAQHATAFVRSSSTRMVVGDWVRLVGDEQAERPEIVAIEPRVTALVRKDPAERLHSQVLAANFDLIVITQPLASLSIPRLERELVLAHETHASVAVALTKADQRDSDEQLDEARQAVRDLVGSAPVLVVSTEDPASIKALRDLIAGRCAVLMGASGVGKSSLVNLLAGAELQRTQEVRETDGKGRHTTVSRSMVLLDDGASIIDMPGIRGMGLWDASEGIAAAFADIVSLAEDCRFRDCRHGDEPGCAVQEAVRDGALSPRRLAAYRRLWEENELTNQKRVEAERLRSRTGRPQKRGKGRPW